MSLVTFPFKGENPETMLHNIAVAASHPRVQRVLCVGADRDDCYDALEVGIPALVTEHGTPIDLILQERIGSKRPGKGDGMNTALRYFLDDTDLERIHFYDSDITSFDATWITKAEEAADFDYGVVRHYFPRASTDAMITWLVTRTGFAIGWPHSELPWIEQPLGGELLFTRPVVEGLVADERVQAQSDWGIDTLYTFTTVQAGHAMYEAYMPQGKAHSLYGRLTDLRTMLVECFSAVQSLLGTDVPQYLPHRIEPQDQVPQAIAEKIGYDIEPTMTLLTQRWTDRQAELLEHFPIPVRDGMHANRQRPTYTFMGEDAWYETYCTLLSEFDRDDEDWRELLFKLWTVRVLNYTITEALRGYGPAMRYLRSMVVRSLRRSWDEG